MTAPKNVKQPTDHQPKKATAKAEVNPLATVEFHGYTYTVDLRGGDDIDVMDMMADAKLTGDEGSYMAAFSLMLRKLLGDDYARWKREQRVAHAAHKIDDPDAEDAYDGDCECEGRLGSFVMQSFLQEAGQGNS